MAQKENLGKSEKTTLFDDKRVSLALSAAAGLAVGSATVVAARTISNRRAVPPAVLDETEKNEQYHYNAGKALRHINLNSKVYDYIRTTAAAVYIFPGIDKGGIKELTGLPKSALSRSLPALVQYDLAESFESYREPNRYFPSESLEWIASDEAADWATDKGLETFTLFHEAVRRLTSQECIIEN